MVSQSKKDGKDQESVQSIHNLTQDTKWGSDKNHNKTSQTRAKSQSFPSR